MTDDLFDGVFFFAFDHVWGRPRIVRSVRSGLMIGCEKGCMEYVVDAP